MTIDEQEYQLLKAELDAQRKTIEVLARINSRLSNTLNRIRTIITEPPE